ncbi:MAG TPA: hypothetical protein VG815_16825 [Chloroflexota bacterium]|jgi:hypothetical protein|nr:hypothetical protein [Chloroflexota bacterium]
MSALGAQSKRPALTAVLIVTVILAATWAVALNARETISHWVYVNVVQLPSYPRAGRTYYTLVGIHASTLFAQISTPRFKAWVVRYRLDRHRWMPGHTKLPLDSSATVSPAGTVWSLNYNGDGGLEDSALVTSFGKGYPWSTRVGGLSLLGSAVLDYRSGPVPYFNSKGTAWEVGWPSAADPTSPSGDPVLATAARGQHQFHLIAVPYRASSAYDPAGSGMFAPLTIAPNGDVWLADGDSRVCRRTRCYRAWLIQYRPSTGRFRRYLVPRSMYRWPAVGQCHTALAPCGFAVTAVEANGTVWAWSSFDRRRLLVEFHHGSFRVFHSSSFRQLDLSATTFVDHNGDLWFCEDYRTPMLYDPGTPVLYNPKNNSTTALSLSGGVMTQDARGDMVYVEHRGQSSWCAGYAANY